MKNWPRVLALWGCGIGAADCTNDAGAPGGAATPTPAPAVAPVESAPVEPAPVAKAPVATVKNETPTPEVAAPTPEVAASPVLDLELPAANDTKTPAVVFAGVVQDGTWSVDIVDFAGIDVKPLERELEASVAADEDSGRRRTLKAGDPALPPGFAVGDPWTLITTAGAEHRRATAFEAFLGDGSGVLHLYVRLGKAPKKAKGPGLALRGHVDLAAAKLVVPKAMKPAELGPNTRERITKVVAVGLEPVLEDESEELSAVAHAAKIRETEVELFAGRFAGDRTHVAFVKTEPSEDDDDGMRISGVLFVKADGSVELFGLIGVWNHVDFLGLLDVNGDGLDEVFYEDGYHEGWSLEMIQWSGEAPARRTVTGDGL